MLSDWRDEILARVRRLITQADADVVEEVKWRKPSNAMAGVPVWSHDGIICTGETYKEKVKLTFAKGASLPDPTGLFNSSLDGNTRRAIDLHEGDEIDVKAFKALVKSAVALNMTARPTARASRSSAARRSVTREVPAVPSKPRPAALRRQSVGRTGVSIHKDILAYNAAQSTGDRRICDALAHTIERHLPGSESKIWHRHPVWFLDGNPIVGYSKLKDCIRLLFWSGQSFEEPGLSPEGSFKAAEARYISDDQISVKDLKRWLGKSIEVQWDYKNIVKRKGRLERLK